MKLRALDPLLHPQYEDVLHKKSSFVEHFYQLITQSIEPPFAISIDGLWGTGKTTVMKMLESKLQERGYPVFWFNPWEYQDAESIVLAFLQYLANEASSKIGKVVYEGLKILGTVGLLGLDVAMKALPQKFLSFLFEGISFSLEEIKEKGEMIEKEYDKEYAKYKDLIKIIKADFTEIIQNISKKNEGKPVIIFFDDLDRCLPDKAIQLLEAVKNLFVIPETNVIFICGIDTRVAKQFIRSHYKEIEENFAINYFRKIFNLTVSMPFGKNIKELLIEKIQELYGWDTQKANDLAEIIYNVGIQTEMLSVRKYLNVLYNFYTFQKFNPRRFQLTEQTVNRLNQENIPPEIIRQLTALQKQEETTEEHFRKGLAEVLGQDHIEHTLLILKYGSPDEFVIHLLVLKEAWQPLYEALIRKALRVQTEFLGKIIEDFIQSRKARDDRLTEQEEKFLKYYFVRKESPFYEIQLANDYLYKYPTLL